jgi:hypothetical protein
MTVKTNEKENARSIKIKVKRHFDYIVISSGLFQIINKFQHGYHKIKSCNFMLKIRDHVNAKKPFELAEVILNVML